MSALLLIGVIATVAFLIFRPAPRTQVFYVPIELTEQPRGLGCLPVILFVIFLVLVLGLIRW